MDSDFKWLCIIIGVIMVAYVAAMCILAALGKV
jgi:hypothetical protein